MTRETGRCWLMQTETSRWITPGLLGLSWLSVAGCNRSHQSDGEKLARTYCASCHAFPEPQLLDKKAWETGVLPQMAPRLGVQTGELFNAAFRNPHMVVLAKGASQRDWQQIAQYYRESARDTLPYQTLPAQP